jgi:hypothetical protein
MDEVSIVGNFVMHELWFDVREALTIWLSLVVLTLLVCAVLSVTSQRGRARRAARRTARVRRVAARGERRARAGAATPDRRTQAGGRTGAVAGTAAAGGTRAGRGPGRGAVVAAGAVPAADPVVDLRRYAEEVAVAASRATATAERSRQEWRAVLNAQEAAWRAYERADRAARRSLQASVFPVPETPLTADEVESRKRYLVRAATTAYHRGELTLEELSAAVMYRDGWDPDRHPFELDLFLRCTGRFRLLRSYQAVSDIERSAWRQADMAAAAQRSLNDEAFAAAMRAHRAAHPSSAHPSTPRPRQLPPVAERRPAPSMTVARGRVAMQLVRGVTSS